MKKEPSACQSSLNFLELIPPEARKVMEGVEGTYDLPPTDLTRSACSRLYMLIKRPSASSWSFPVSGVVTDAESGLGQIATKVAASMLNGFSDGTDITGAQVDSSASSGSQEEDDEDDEPKVELTMKQLRRLRKAAREKKGVALRYANAKAKKVVPNYLHFIGNSPMGVMHVKGRE